MRIGIGNKHVLTSDYHNLIINEVKVKKVGGEPYLKAMSYHTNLKDVVRALVERGVKGSDAKSLAELAEHVEKLRVEIMNAVPDMKTEFYRQHKTP